MTYGPTHTVDTAPAESLWHSHYKPEEKWISVKITEELLRTEAHSFGIFDKKGREVGARVKLFEEVVVPTTGGTRIAKEAGRWLLVTPHALRDGSPYGAYHDGKRFDSVEAAEAHIERYFADAEKRARKQFGA